MQAACAGVQGCDDALPGPGRVPGRPAGGEPGAGAHARGCGGPGGPPANRGQGRHRAVPASRHHRAHAHRSEYEAESMTAEAFLIIVRVHSLCVQGYRVSYLDFTGR